MLSYGLDWRVTAAFVSADRLELQRADHAMYESGSAARHDTELVRLGVVRVVAKADVLPEYVG
jgi:hypothetical protein